MFEGFTTIRCSGAHSRLLNAMTELGHDQFAVLGHDRGSYYALQMALGYPDRVKSSGLSCGAR